MCIRDRREYINEATSLTIYKQFVLPKLEYASTVLESGPKDLCNKLQVLQNRGLRICKRIHKAREVHINDLHDDCKIDTLEVRRKRSLLCHMYKWSRDEQNILYKPTIRTRQDKTMQLKIPNAKDCKAYSKTPRFRGNEEWKILNNKDPQAAYCPTIQAFKASITKLGY